MNAVEVVSLGIAGWLGLAVLVYRAVVYPLLCANSRLAAGLTDTPQDLRERSGRFRRAGQPDSEPVELVEH
jgi:hypothetical protein